MEHDGIGKPEGEIVRRPVPDAVGGSDRIMPGETVVVGVYKNADRCVMTFQRPVVYVEMSQRFAQELGKLIIAHSKPE